MNAPVLNRHRIERYAQLLDEANGARRHHARSPIDHELMNMLAAGQRLTALPISIEPTDDFRVTARARIMARAERDGIGKTAIADVPRQLAVRPAIGRASVGTIHESAARRLMPKQLGAKARLTTNRARTRGAILVGLAVGTLALSGISAASGDAMPGDALYGMKRQAENAQIALARTPVSRGDLYLDFARTRLSEAEQARPSSSTLIGTLATMDSQTNAGAKYLFTDALNNKDPKALATVDQFAAQQSKQLQLWIDGLPLGAARDRALVSWNVIDHIQKRSALVHGALACTSTVKILSNGAIGPEPLCQDGATAATNAPAHHSGGISTGTGAKPAEHTPPSTTPASAPATVPDVSVSIAPGSQPSYDGGLLGSVEHLLGGL